MTNSQLVLNILSVNTSTTIPVNFSIIEDKSINCLSTLTTIPEVISAEPSCSNLHDLSKQNIAENSWCIYGNDQDNSKSTDALLTDEQNAQSIYANNINFSVIKENQHKSNPLARVSLEVVDIPNMTRNRSDSKSAIKTYDPISSESLTDSQGYMDDFDESCALITNENIGNKRKMSSSSEAIIKRSGLGPNKTPQNHRFSAGDADRLEKGIKSMPSTRSLRDS